MTQFPFGRQTVDRRRILQGLAALSAAGMSSYANPFARGAAAQDGPIRFGVSGPFSGNNAEYGRIWQQAMNLAAEEINANGIRGRQLELVYEDTQSDPKQSVPVAQKFVSDPTIVAELGDFASPASMAASPIYERGKLVQFGFTNSHPDFTKGGEFMFSTTLSQEQDAAFLAQTAFEAFGGKQAVLYRNTDWGKITHELYVNKLEELGGEVAAVENYLENEKDFRSLLAKVRDVEPEVVTLISYYTDGALIAQQAQSVDLGAQLVANGACNSPQFIELGGEAVNGVLTTTVFFPGAPRPEAEPFVAAYRERYDEDPDSFAALAYDGVKILAWAAEQGGPEREAIQRTLVEGTEIPSIVFGPFRFAADRRVENAEMVPIQVQDGQFVAYEG
ncbi:MAG: ABC transporter substrate-binding protein [Chloroflexi bacterium]|nr:ABC transporter substrate-binding protein [Chloroflexota bacterium]